MFLSTLYTRYLNHSLWRGCTLLIILNSIFYGIPAQAFAENIILDVSNLKSFNQWQDAEVWSSWVSFRSGDLNCYAIAEDKTGIRKKGYNWEGPPAESPDWQGIRQDTFYFFALQFAAVVVLYLAPERLSGWDQEAKDNYNFSRWVENVTNPVWDDDQWWVNYILHPYWGATYYIRGQERGLKRSQSFWYSFLLSALYEFGAEALFEPVSYQDLIVTPVGGALVGEFLFVPIRKLIRSKDRLYWTDKAVLFITDPLGVVSEELSRIFGTDTQVSFRQLQRKDTLPALFLTDVSEIGPAADVHDRPIWGLRLRMLW